MSGILSKKFQGGAQLQKDAAQNILAESIEIVVSLTVSSTIPAGSYIEVTLPKWDSVAYGASAPYGNVDNGLACQDDDTSTAYTCSLTSDTSSSADDTLTISGMFVSETASGTTVNVLVQNFLNYPLMVDYDVVISVLTSDGN